MSDHHDFGDHDDFGLFDHQLDHGLDHQLDPHEEPAHYDDDLAPHHEDPPQFDQPHELYEHAEPADEPAPVPEPAEDPLDVFPPQVDVGELPEPVDGFPWIDTGSLGVVHAAAIDPADPVRPDELAAYAGEDLPPGADPWAALEGSEDPATSTLARWWHDN
jgi:hypothetical protein